MAMSNVRSSRYKAAGGQAWHRYKGQDNTVRWDGPVSEHIETQRHHNAVRDDQNVVDKAKVREQLASGYDESLITVIPAGKRAKRNNKRK